MDSRTYNFRVYIRKLGSFWDIAVTYDTYQWSNLIIRSLDDLEELELTIHKFLQEQKDDKNEQR